MAALVKTFIGGFAKAFALIGEKTVLIDCGPKDGRKTVENALAKIGVSPSDVSLIVITHGHSDHVAPLAALKELTGAPVLCHEKAAAALREGWGEAIVPRTAPARFIVRLSPGNSEKNRRPIETDIAVSEETDLSPFGINAKIIPTPGHTAGSLSVLTAEGDAFIGDLIMHLIPGRPDLPLLATDVEAVKASLRKLLDLGARRFHMAHGRAVGRTGIERILEGASS